MIKKNYTFILLILLMVFQLACGQNSKPQTNSANIKSTESLETQKSNLTKYPNLQKLAESYCNAMVSYNYEIIADLTYPKLIKSIGGREKAIILIKNNSETTESQGFKIESIQIEKILQIEQVEDELFTLFPIIIKSQTPKGEVVGQTTMLGISNDSGETWTFVDGLSKEKIKVLFPKVAEKLRVPADKRIS